MIEVRVPLDHIKHIQHEVTQNILLVERLKKAGIPIIGRLVLSGVEHGKLEHEVEEDIDGDTLVYRWVPAPGRAIKKPTTQPPLQEDDEL